MMPHPSASTPWSAARPGRPRSSDHAPAPPTRPTEAPPLLSLDEYVSIVTAGPQAMARALGRYVRPPATLAAEAPSASAPPNDAAPETPAETTWNDEVDGPDTDAYETFRTDEPNVEMHRDDPAPEIPAETARHDHADESPEEMLWLDGVPDTTEEPPRHDHADGPDTAANEMSRSDEPNAGTMRPTVAEPNEPASDAPASDEKPAPEVMSTLTIPMPTVEDEPSTTAPDGNETAPANAPSPPEEDPTKSNGARRWSWPWRS